MIRHTALTLTLLALLGALACTGGAAPADAPQDAAPAATPEPSQDAPTPKPALGAPAPQPVASPPALDPTSTPLKEKKEIDKEGAREGDQDPPRPQDDATPPKTGLGDFGTTGKGAGSGQAPGIGGGGKPAKGIEAPDKQKQRRKPGDKDDKGDNYMEDFGVE